MEGVSRAMGRGASPDLVRYLGDQMAAGRDSVGCAPRSWPFSPEGPIVPFKMLHPSDGRR